MKAFPNIPEWEQFERQLRGYIRNRVPAAAEDDIYGDVVLRLLSHADKFESARSPIAWVYRVTANRIADYYRERSREPLDRGVAVETLESVSGEPAPGGRAGEELADCILPLIRHLPARYGEALMLTEIEGMKQAEAARKLGLSTSGMKSRVQRGRDLLKRSILKCCHVSMNRRGHIQDFQPKESCCQAAKSGQRGKVNRA